MYPKLVGIWYVGDVSFGVELVGPVLVAIWVDVVADLGVWRSLVVLIRVDGCWVLYGWGSECVAWVVLTRVGKFPMGLVFGVVVV
jgi:hypothetical protein